GSKALSLAPRLRRGNSFSARRGSAKGAMKETLAEPLLGTHPKPKLAPLYAVSLIRTTGVATAMMPAFNLRIAALGAAAGHDAAAVANAMGLISALRSFSEFTAAPLLASWSDRLGRKKALLASALAFTLETALLA
ncbi:unnamed protein product, partial [Effrenium voratum]